MNTGSFLTNYQVEKIKDTFKDFTVVVRCKDCEHCYYASNRAPSERTYACDKHGIDVKPDWFCADGEKEDGVKMIDIRTDVPGLWCDDITFCPAQCDWKCCPRNQLNIRDTAVPHSVFLEIPGDCPKRIGGNEK